MNQTSYNLLHYDIYKHGKKDLVSYYQELCAIEPEYFWVLVGEEAVEAYDLIQKTPLELFIILKKENLEIETLNKLISSDACEVYRNGWISFEELKKFDGETIEALIFSDAQKAYKNKWVTFDALKEFNTKKIAALVSSDACEAYKNNWISFELLKEFDCKKIEALVSSDACEAYKSTYVTFTALKEFDSKKIKLLISPLACEAYKNKYFSFEQLKMQDNSVIQVLTLPSAYEGFEKGWFSFNELQKLDINKMRLLTSSDAVECYENHGFKFSDLNELEIEKIRILLEEPKLAFRCQSYKNLPFEEFNDSCQFVTKLANSIESKMKTLVKPKSRKDLSNTPSNDLCEKLRQLYEKLVGVKGEQLCPLQEIFEAAKNLFQTNFDTTVKLNSTMFKSTDVFTKELQPMYERLNKGIGCGFVATHQ